MYKFILACTLLLMLSACSLDAPTYSENTDPTPTPLPPEPAIEQPTYTVQRGDVVRELDFTARVAAEQEARLFFLTDGYLSRLAVQRGDAVRAGEVLAELTMADLQRQLESAQLELAQAHLESTRTISRTLLTLRDQQLALERVRAISPAPDIRRAEVDVATAQRALNDAQREYQESLDREWEPPDQRQYYADTLAGAQTALDIARVEYAAAVQERAYTLRQLEVAVSQARLEHSIALDGVDPTLAQKVTHLQAQIDERRIIAPFEGQVLSLVAAPGDRIDAYAHVLIVGDPAVLELRADLSAEQIGELQVGQPVTLISGEVGAQPFEGRIRQLPYGWGNRDETVGSEDAEATASGNNRAVRITPGSNAPSLELDQLLRATAILQHHADVLWLPPAAIQEFRGRTFVFVQDPDGVQRRVDIVTGIETEARVEILTGLTEGQTVIIP